MTNKPKIMLWLDDHRGRYIPRDFANSFIDRDKHVNMPGYGLDDWAILDDPDHEWYWDAWQDVCDNATVTDENGIKYTLHQDGALWLIPEGMEWSDSEDGFVWPDEEPLDSPGWEGGFVDNH